MDDEISAAVIVADILFTATTGLIVDAYTGGLHKHYDLHNKIVFYDFQIGKIRKRNMPIYLYEDEENE